jgi:hypothetical protein
MIRAPPSSVAPPRVARWGAGRPAWPVGAAASTARPSPTPAAAATAVIHVLAEQATLAGVSDHPGLATTATLTPLTAPAATPDPGYRPTTATARVGAVARSAPSLARV